MTGSRCKQPGSLEHTLHTSDPNHWDIRCGVSPKSNTQQKQTISKRGTRGSLMFFLDMMLFLSLGVGWSWIACLPLRSSCIFPPYRPCPLIRTQVPKNPSGSWLSKSFRGKFDMSYRLSQAKSPLALCVSPNLVGFSVYYSVLTLVSGLVHESQSVKPRSLSLTGENYYFSIRSSHSQEFPQHHDDDKSDKRQCILHLCLIQISLPENFPFP